MRHDADILAEVFGEFLVEFLRRVTRHGFRHTDNDTVFQLALNHEGYKTGLRLPLPFFGTELITFLRLGIIPNRFYRQIHLAHFLGRSQFNIQPLDFCLQVTYSPAGHL